MRGTFQHSIFQYSMKVIGQTPHRAAQPPTLAVFPPWGGSAGAGRATPTGVQIYDFCREVQLFFLKCLIFFAVGCC